VVRTHARYATSLVRASALALALVTGCTASEVADGRGPVSLADWEAAVVAEDTLELMIPSCFGEPELASLEYDDDAVRVEVITTVVDEGPACADVLRVELAEPLGDRQVVDVTSGEAMRITRPTATPE
jgi:hypothetical protein